MPPIPLGLGFLAESPLAVMADLSPWPGALNLYSPLNEVFGPDLQRRARTFAAEASEHRASRSDSLTRRSSARTSKLPWHRAPSSTKR
jgi:hypothetical protein